MLRTDLLPCPCCGKSDLEQWPCEWLDGSGDNVVRCAWCHCAAPMNTWNRRAAPPAQAVSVPDGVVAYLAESRSERYVFHGDDAVSLKAYSETGFRITELAKAHCNAPSTLAGSMALDALKSIAAVMRDPMLSPKNQGDHALRIAIAAIAALSAAPAAATREGKS